MPDLIINIGGYDFEIACAPGEENSLKSAVELLDQEAKKLIPGKSKLPETKMLLMISLIMADELLNVSKPNKPGSQTIDKTFPTIAADPDANKKNMATPRETTERLVELISQAEALADEIEEKFN